MSYEIIGESIKSATSLKLGELFPNCVRYKENITNQTYPNFHIVQVNVNATPRQRVVQRAYNKECRRIQLDYLMNIQYRVAKDTEAITNLRQQLDNIGLKLLVDFKDLNLNYPTEVNNARYEIVDGILQFFFNIRIFIETDLQNNAIMQELQIQI